MSLRCTELREQKRAFSSVGNFRLCVVRKRRNECDVKLIEMISSVIVLFIFESYVTISPKGNWHGSLMESFLSKDGFQLKHYLTCFQIPDIFFSNFQKRIYLLRRFFFKLT